MSDAFVLSQYEYYKKHLLSGPYHSKNLIQGLFLKYSQEARKRNLIK